MPLEINSVTYTERMLQCMFLSQVSGRLVEKEKVNLRFTQRTCSPIYQ